MVKQNYGNNYPLAYANVCSRLSRHRSPNWRRVGVFMGADTESGDWLYNRCSFTVTIDNRISQHSITIAARAKRVPFQSSKEIKHANGSFNEGEDKSDAIDEIDPNIPVIDVNTLTFWQRLKYGI